MRIAKYEIIEKLAEAPRAAVFKVYSKDDPNRLLVLKVLKAGSLSEYQKAQIRQKIEHLKVLNDTRVITPIAFESDDGVCFITQGYFGGVTLDELIEARSSFPVGDFFTIACGVAQALEKVHEAGIIHGGI